MNPRSVHARFRKHCPPVDFAKCDWSHVFSDGRLNEALLVAMLSTLEASHFLIHVTRMIGDYLPRDEAVAFIRENIGKNMIYVADRSFARMVIVTLNGVAAAWSSGENG